MPKLFGGWGAFPGRNMTIGMCVTLALLLSACESEGASPAQTAPAAVTETEAAAKSEDAMSLQLTIGDKTYPVILEDCDAVRELTKRLPMELTMDELNGNEKYTYLEKSLPADSRRVGTIHAGDLMLYGSDCLVLFYEDFQTSYSYTRLGHLEASEELAEAVGTGSVQIRFD